MRLCSRHKIMGGRRREAAVAKTKILMITMEFELGSRKAHGTRIQAAYEAAEKAALNAVQSELLPDSVEEVRSNMYWSYRYAQDSNQTTLNIEDAEDAPGYGEIEP